MDDKITSAAKSLIAQQEQIIKKVLGVSAVNESVIARLEMCTCAATKWETVFFDGSPVVMFGPVVVELVDTGTRKESVFSRQVRYLTDEITRQSK